MKKIITKTLGIVALVVGNSTAQALPVTLSGDTINYVYDDQQAAIALFGAPTIIGDAVRFAPGSFRAESTDGAGAIIASAEFIFSSVYSKTGSMLTAINLFEFGDYRIDDGGAVTAAATLTVTNNGGGAETMVRSESFAASGDSAGLSLWTLSVVANPAAQFASIATDISLSIENILTATTSTSGELAWIQKKFAIAAVASDRLNPPASVPVPGVLWLLAIALPGLVLSRRQVLLAPTVGDH